MCDDNQYILSLIIADLEKEIPPLEAKRVKAHESQLASFDFTDKYYYSSVQARYEAAIDSINKAKEIVTKHLTK